MVGVAVAPTGGGAVQTLGPAQVALAWSTSKVPVIVTLLHDYENGKGSLDADERTDVQLALEQSDNAAIDALFSRLEQIHGGLVAASRAMDELLRQSGDNKTIVNIRPNNRGFTTEGQTEWSLRGEVLFYRALAQGCLLTARDTGYLMQLMRNVVPSERWGIGSAGYRQGVAVAFKGGWGPDLSGRYQVRQTGIILDRKRGYVVALLALPTSGSFSDGTSMLTTLATWARKHLDLSPTRLSASSCGKKQ